LALGIDSTARSTSGSVCARMRSLSSLLNAVMYIFHRQTPFDPVAILGKFAFRERVRVLQQIVVEFREGHVVRHPVLGKVGIVLTEVAARKLKNALFRDSSISNESAFGASYFSSGVIPPPP